MAPLTMTHTPEASRSPAAVLYTQLMVLVVDDAIDTLRMRLCRRKTFGEN